MESLRGALAALVTGISAALVIVALAILPFLNPVWVSFAQERAQAEAWTGFTTEQLAAVTNPILLDLVVGPPDFNVTLDGAAVLNDNERGHMRDVRGVFFGFFAVAVVAAVVLAVMFLVARGPAARARFWRRLERTGIVIVAVTIVGGVIGLLFFDSAFILFHEIFFPGGNYLFDPGTERLVQLFPQQFWVDSAIGVGVVVIVLALAMSWVARRRARTIASRIGPGAEAVQPAASPALPDGLADPASTASPAQGPAEPR
jgi:integral membrane protein (TIGR01906 family)